MFNTPDIALQIVNDSKKQNGFKNLIILSFYSGRMQKNSCSGQIYLIYLIFRPHTCYTITEEIHYTNQSFMNIIIVIGILVYG